MWHYLGPVRNLVAADRVAFELIVGVDELLGARLAHVRRRS